MIRQCSSRFSSGSILHTLFAAVFSLLITVGAHPVVAADGDLDTTFGTGGKVTTAILSQDDFASEVAIQSDGKIVVAGYTKNGSATQFALARYNTDGTLDDDFDTDGKVFTEVGTDKAYGTSVAIQPDGKIVVAGYCLAANGVNADIALVRYNANGSLDTNFGSGGKVTTDIDGGTGADYAYSVALQSDGKIVAAGSSSVGNNIDFALVRYDKNGNLDTDFGTGGKVTTPILSGNDAALSVSIQPDGKIVAAGETKNGLETQFALARYNTDGTLDDDFDTDGKVSTTVGSSYDYAYSVALQSDGKIVAAGRSIPTREHFALVRYNADGSLDTNFGTGGKVTTPIGNDDDTANFVAIQPDGKIVAAGYSYGSSNIDFALVRYKTDGSLDTNFGTGGKVTTPIGGGSDVGTSAAIQSDGKIVVAGHSSNGSNYDFALVRYAGTPPAPPTPVSTLPLFGLGILVSLLGFFGLRKLRQ